MILDKLIDRIADRVIERQRAEQAAQAAKFRKEQADYLQRLRNWTSDVDRISVRFAADAARQLAAMPVKVRTHVRRDPEA